jgi:hypothetical protein
MRSEVGSSKAMAFSSPYMKDMLTAISSSLALSAEDVPFIMRQILSMYDQQVILWYN